MEEKTFNDFIDYLLTKANIELAPNLRAEFGFQAFNRILDASMEALGEELDEDQQEELVKYMEEHDQKETLEYITKNFPRFREIFSEQAELLGDELRERAEGLSKLQ